MTTTYRVDVDGKTVWTETRDSYEGDGVFPAEYLNRPADTPEGEPHPSPVYLYLATDDEEPVLIGIQRSHGHEADVLDEAAQAETDPTVKADIERGAADARSHYQTALAAQATDTKTTEV